MKASPPATERTGPLAGYSVLELGSTIAGPFCARLLGDFGADVVKVESIEGDAVRSMGKQVDGKSLYAASLMRNKSLVAVDLRTEEGRDLVRRLAKTVDILVENFRPGTMERWGLGYDELAADNPGLVMVRISGFGQTGPYRERPGYGVIGEAVSGIRHLTGDPDRPPARTAVSLTDYITGLYAAFGAVMAILSRARTGRGQCVDTALYECAFSFMEPHVPAFDKLGIVPNRAGSRLPDSTPNNLYPTADHSFIHITAMADPVFRRLAAAMGRPELADDPRYAKALDRSRHVDDVDAQIATWTASLVLAELERVLGRAEVPATRIFTMTDIFADPHFAARSMLARVPDETLGEVTVAAVVPLLSATPGHLRQAGGQIGQDTTRVLSSRLGLAPEQIADLSNRQIILAAATHPETEIT